MAVTNIEYKQFTITQGTQIVVKKYTTTTDYSITVQSGSTVINLTAAEWADLYAAIIAAYAQTYTDLP